VWIVQAADVCEVFKVAEAIAERVLERTPGGHPLGALDLGDGLGDGDAQSVVDTLALGRDIRNAQPNRTAASGRRTLANLQVALGQDLPFPEIGMQGEVRRPAQQAGVSVRTRAEVAHPHVDRNAEHRERRFTEIAPS
jgi:hypothetical protein